MQILYIASLLRQHSTKHFANSINNFSDTKTLETITVNISSHKQDIDG